jgi:hypothetical protein
MTKACEKLFKKLPHLDQVAVDKKIKELCKDPTCGDNFRDPVLKGLLHTHVRGSSSNLLVAWSKDEKPKKKIIIEGVGGHKMVDWLIQQRRKAR